jgi:hypothetical protein
MSDLRLRARSVTEIVDAAFQLYKRDPLEYILVAAVAYAPLIVTQLVVLRGAMTLGGPTMALASTSLIVGILSLFVYALMTAVLSRFASDVYLGKPANLREILRWVVRVVPAVVAATFGVVLFWAVGFVPMLVGLALSIPVLVGLGVPFAIGWVLYAVARLFAVYQVIILEQPNVIRAFARSGALSRGRKGHILLTLFLVFVIFFLLSMAVGVVSALVSVFTGNTAVSTALQSVFTVIVYPLIAITQVILYYDMRIRAEGFDIELMASALESPSPGLS